MHCCPRPATAHWHAPQKAKELGGDGLTLQRPPRDASKRTGAKTAVGVPTQPLCGGPWSSAVTIDSQAELKIFRSGPESYGGPAEVRETAEDTTCTPQSSARHVHSPSRRPPKTSRCRPLTSHPYPTLLCRKNSTGRGSHNRKARPRPASATELKVYRSGATTYGTRGKYHKVCPLVTNACFNTFRNPTDAFPEPRLHHRRG